MSSCLSWGLIIFFSLFCKIVSGYTIVSLCQDTQLCLGLFLVVQTFFIFFQKLFPFTFYFPSLKFSRCLPQKITSRYTIVWFVWRVHYCVQLLSWGHDFFFFQSFPLPFPLLAKVCFLLINFFLSFFHLKFSEMPSFPKYMMPY